MSIQIRVSRDTITPDLQRKAARLSDASPVLRAMGIRIASLTQQSFRDAAMRKKP